MKLFLHQLNPLLILLLCDILDRTHIFRFLPWEPLLTLPLIYHWAIYRPEFLSIFTLLILGVFDDAIGGGFLGQTSLMFLMLYAGVLLQKHHIKDARFSSIWKGFAVFMLTAGVLEWVIAKSLYKQIVSLNIFIFQNLLAVLLYPWFNKLIKTLEKRN